MIRRGQFWHIKLKRLNLHNTQLNYYDELIIKYKSKGVIIDTNVLLMYFIGSYNKKIIEEFKRTNVFSISDYDIINNFVNFFDRIFTTPHVLTEVSNLSGQLENKFLEKYFDLFSEKLSILEERNVKAEKAFENKIMRKFGLADACINYIAREKILVLTDDFPLYGVLQKNNIDVINFNNIRFHPLLQ